MRIFLVCTYIVLCSAAMAEDFVDTKMRWNWTTVHSGAKKSYSHSTNVTMMDGAVAIEGIPTLYNKVIQVTNRAGVRDEVSVVIDRTGFTYTAKQSTGFRSKIVARIKDNSCSVTATSNQWKATISCSIVSRGSGWKAKDSPAACAAVADTIADMQRLLSDDHCRNQSKVVTLGRSIKGAGCREKQKDVDALIGKARAKRCVPDPTSPVGVRG